MGKFGLQLRQPKKPSAPVRPSAQPAAFAFARDDDDDVEQEISRQASKNKALQKIEEQHKQALEENPSVFDYDGVYDDMKEKMARPRFQDKTERAPKYIHSLKAAAERRERNREIVFEKKLLKERSKDDHLFADKDKFITKAYREKLQEDQKWLEEDRKREILEAKEDVTKKADLSDFYFGLSKNVAFGGRLEGCAESSKDQADKYMEQNKNKPSDAEASLKYTEDRKGNDQNETSDPQNHSEDIVPSPERPIRADTFAEGSTTKGEASAHQNTGDRYKRSEEALAAAKERFLSRKRSKLQD